MIEPEWNIPDCDQDSVMIGIIQCSDNTQETNNISDNNELER